MLRITKSAREILLSILEDHPGFTLRLFADGFGRNTPELGLSLDRPQARDRRLQLDGMAIYLADEIALSDGEKVIDFHPGRGQGLVVRTATGDR
jgi:hypothetical protein